MATASEFESFSIREYASRMRSIDVEKSWPFGGGGELKREEIGGLLPPIVCRKYRWWLDEVARSASEVQEDSTPKFQKVDEVAEETAVNLKEMSSLGLEKRRIEEAEADLGAGKAVLGLDEESAVKICPVCGTFVASTVNAVNAHIDVCLVQVSRAERRQTREKKAKSRMQKKRSIVELFAVAPQIVAVDEDGEGDGVAGVEDGGCGADAVSKKMRRKKKLKELMEMMMKKNQKKKNKNKMIMSKKQHRKGILSLLTRLDKKKEKIHKLKMPSEVDYAQILQCSLQNKKLVKKNIDPLGSRKGKSSNINSLLKKNQLKNFRAKSIVKLQAEPSIFPIQSILKDESRATSLQKASSTGKLHGVNLVEQKKGRHSDRHVRFSGKDEFLGHTESWNSSNKLPQKKNVCEGFSDVVAASSAEDQLVEVKHIPAMDEARQVTGSDIDVSVSIMDGSEVQSVQDDRCLADNHSCDAPCPVIISRNRVCHDMGNILFDNSVDLNKPSLHHDSLHLFNPCSSNPSLKFAGFLESPHYVPKERDLSLHAEGNAQRTMTRGSLHDPFASPFPASTTDSLANITRDATSRPSLSCSALNMEMNEKQPYPSPGASPNSNGCALHYQQFRPICPDDLTNSICFSTGERKKQLSYRSGHYGESRSIVDPIFRCSDKCADEDFIGLPLNSQGELINLHLSGKMGLSQVFKKQNTTFGSVGSFLISNVAGHNSIIDHSNKNDRPPSTMSFPSLKMFPEQHYLKNPTHAPAFSTLGLSAMKNIGREIQSSVAGKEKEQSSHWLDSELHLMNISCPGCTAYNQCHNHSGKEKDQSMENSNGGFQPIAQPTLRLMGKNVTVGRSNRDCQDFEDGKVWTDKEVITVQHLDHSVPRCFPEDRITHPASRISEKLNHIVEAQSCPNSPSSFQMKAVEPGSAGRYNCPTHLMSLNALPTIHGNRATEMPPLAHALLNNATKVQKNGYSGTEFVKMSNRIPAQASSSQNDCLQHMLMNSTQSKRHAGLTFRAISNFNMSCSNHDSGGHVQPSYMQFSSPVLPQISNAAQQKGTLYSYPSQPPDSFPNHHPCFMSRKNLPPAPSYFTSMFSYPSHRSNITELCLQNPFTVGSSAPPPIPSLPAFKSASVIKSNCRKRDKLMDIGKFKSTFSKDRGHSKKGKKRPAEKADLANESVKKPNLEMQNKNIAIGSKNLEELHGYGEKMVDGDFSGKEIVKDGKGSGEKMVDVDLSSKEIAEDGLGTAASFNAFKPDGVVRSGPIKLSAGAKHVLRPSQTMDQDSLKPTHSTLPCEVVTDTSKVPDFQKKLAKIYRF